MYAIYGTLLYFFLFSCIYVSMECMHAMYVCMLCTHACYVCIYVCMECMHAMYVCYVGLRACMYVMLCYVCMYGIS